jgi:TonB-dependent starch-binding outer membrane protein SusC
MSTPQPESLRRLLLAVALLAGSQSVVGACAPKANGSGAPSQGQLITAEDLQRYPNEPIERILERKVPGVQAIRTSSGGLALRVRGITAWDGRQRPPLYVLNGLTVAAGAEGAMPNINIEDIETITVLRGPEAAIYGVDGANGVIVITTKKGPQQ